MKIEEDKLWTKEMEKWREIFKKRVKWITKELRKVK